MLAGSSFAEEGIERVVSTPDGLVGWHLAVGLDAVLQTVQLPAGIADLNTGLANVDRNAFPLKKKNHLYKYKALMTLFPGFDTNW